MTEPRISPLPEAEWTKEQHAIVAPLGPTKNLNIFATMMHSPDALKGFLHWGGYIMSDKNSLSARDRELVILRTGHLCNSDYEVYQHEAIGASVGLTTEEIEAVSNPISDGDWSAADLAMLQACDQLNASKTIDDQAWVTLGQHFTERQCMDVVLTAGQYTLVSMLLNSFGVQIED